MTEITLVLMVGFECTWIALRRTLRISVIFAMNTIFSSLCYIYNHLPGLSHTPPQTKPHTRIFVSSYHRLRYPSSTILFHNTTISNTNNQPAAATITCIKHFRVRNFSHQRRILDRISIIFLAKNGGFNIHYFTHYRKGFGRGDMYSGIWIKQTCMYVQYDGR